MTLHRPICIALTLAMLAACQRDEQPAVSETPPEAAAEPVAEVVPEDVPVQEPSPSEDYSAVPDFAWTLPDDAARVLGTANIYLAGQTAAPVGEPPRGTLPPAIDLGSAATIQFPVIEGGLSCAAGPPTDGPDGAQCVSESSDIEATNGFSASRSSNRTLYLVGVFPVAPDPEKEVEAGVAPETDTELRITPKANQVFLIGDGKTADGQLQTFVKPEGATTLYLGFADGSGFQGGPYAYEDNYGHLRYTFELDPK